MLHVACTVRDHWDLDDGVKFGHDTTVLLPTMPFTFAFEKDVLLRMKRLKRPREQAREFLFTAIKRGNRVGMGRG